MSHDGFHVQVLCMCQLLLYKFIFISTCPKKRRQSCTHYQSIPPPQEQRSYMHIQTHTLSTSFFKSRYIVNRPVCGRGLYICMMPRAPKMRCAPSYIVQMATIYLVSLYGSEDLTSVLFNHHPRHSLRLHPSSCIPSSYGRPFCP